MPAGERHARPTLTRADLPAELTPETLRELSFSTLRQLADHRNGVLDEAEQRAFDAAFPEVLRATAARIRDASGRAPRDGPRSGDPTLRRSYERAQRRLAEQTRRARERFPELALEHPDGAGAGASGSAGTPSTAGSTTTEAPEPDASGHDVSPSALEEEVEQTSDTLDLLEKIASLQRQQLERQETQRLTDTRGFFFAFLVSIAVIVAGIAPLVEAEPHERLLIVVWTVAVTAVAGLVYALIRWVQRSR